MAGRSVVPQQVQVGASLVSLEGENESFLFFESFSEFPVTKCWPLRWTLCPETPPTDLAAPFLPLFTIREARHETPQRIRNTTPSYFASPST